MAERAAAPALEGDVEQEGTTTERWRTRRALVAALVFVTAAVLPGIHAFGAGSPSGDVAAAWPVAWSVYRYADGSAIIDVNGDENPVDTDLASGVCTGTKCSGGLPSVQWAGDGTNVFFRVRLAADPWDATKGGLRSSAYLVQLAINGTVAAVVGVDGKSASSDYVYVTDSVGGIVNPIYTWPFDASGGINSAALRTMPDGQGQFFLDFQVPLARMTAINPAITATTPLQLYYGSSAAANLATINKDFMRGDVSAVDFTGLSTVTFGAAGVSLSRSVTSISGTDPPTTGATSTYDIPLTLTQTGGADLDNATFTVTVPAGVTVSSLSTATGTISQTGSTITWSAGTLTSGASATATVRASVTPAGDAAGSTITLLSALAATGTDHTTGAARSASAADVTVGPVAQGNRAPTTVSDSLTVDEDGSGSVGVLTNDVDPDGDALTASIVGAPANGTATITAGGLLTYTPDADYHGADSVTYRACDPAGACTDGTVAVTVDPVNDTPVAAGDDLTTFEDTPVGGTAGAVDVDGDTLTFSVVGLPASGTVSMDSSGAFTYTPAAGTSGTDDFTFEVCDPSAACSTALLTITVTAVDDTPVANDDVAAVDEDDAVVMDVLSNDVDGDGDALTASVVSGPASGSIVVAPGAGGAITYTPDANFHGADSFSYRACDAGGLCSAAATVSITVAPVNDAPVAGDDAASVDEDGSVTIDVLADDVDVDGDDLTVTIDTAPSDGSVSVASDGSISYTPDANFHGPDSFTYEVCDGAGACDLATVAITVRPVNDTPVANGATLTTAEDTAGGGTLVATDVDGDDITLSLAVDADHGTVVVEPGGTYTYTPDANFHGPDAFTYSACDPSGACATAVVTVTVVAVNDAPVAGDDRATVAEDGSVTIDVLANDTDVDGDTVSVAGGGVSTPANGTATVEADGSITYAPDADYAGADSFTYTACDPSGACAVATVTVTVSGVNDGPVAAAIALSTDEDTPVDGTGVAGDVDGDPLTFSIVSAPGRGAATMAGDGTFTYVPDADTSGPDSFTYRACDPSASCSVATVSISVGAVNDAPVAVDAALDTPEGQAVSSMAGASDVDGDVLEFSLVSGPSAGTLTLDPAGAFTYTPDAGVNGVDAFTFQACDPAGACSAATITIDVGAVNDAPVAGNGTLTTDEDTAAGGAVVATDADGDPLTYSVSAGPTNGTLVLDGAGTYTYTPDPDFHGTDTFTYEACDAASACDTAVVTVTVTAVNDTPIAGNGTLSTNEDTPAGGTVAATDVDGDPLTYSVSAGPTNGTLVLDSDGTYTYTPDADFHGTDTFTYEACDAASACDTAVVTVTVTAVNDAPVASGSSLTTDEDTPAGGTVAATDVDGDPLTYSVDTGPTNGTLVLDGDGTYTYTPDADFHGTDTFTYEACDPAGACDTAVVTITVTAVNDTPVAAGSPLTTDEDTPAGGTVAATDVDGDPLTFSVSAGPSNGTLVLDADGTYTYTPDADFHGTDSFTYEACDGAGACDTAVVTITVTAVNDTPAAGNSTLSTNEDTPADGTVTGTDIDGDPLTYAIDAGPTNGTLVLDGDGTYTYTPDPDFHGADSFTYEACDPAGACDTAVVTITVADVNEPPAAVDGTAQTPAGTAVVGTIDGTDADGDVLTWTLATPPAHGTVEPVAGEPTRYRYTPDPGWSGIDAFVVDVCDPSGACTPATITVTVLAAEAPPAPTTTTTIASAPSTTTTSTTTAPAPAPSPIVQLPMLPRTGAGLAVQALGGLGLLGLGAAFVVAGRRRRTPTD